MKKVTTFALGFAALMSVGTAMAETKTITTKNEFTAAIASERAADGVDTLYIKPSSDNTLSIGSIKSDAGVTCEKGTLVIIGITDEATGERPIIMTDWQFGTNEESDNFSLIIDNCNLQYRTGAAATSGQIFYANKKVVYFKEFTLKNCEITNYARTIIRTVPTDADATTGVINYGGFEHFEISDCDIHYADISSGNTWACIVMGSPMTECVLTGNVFYDMPYNKQIMSMSYINKEYVNLEDTDLKIENNAFYTATQQTNPLFDFGSSLGQMATYSIQNNIFLRPTWENDLNLAAPTTEDSLGNVSAKQGQILRSSYGMYTIQNNVIDGYYKESDGDWTRDQYYDSDGEGAWFDAQIAGNVLPADIDLSWGDYSAPDAGDFYLFNGHKAYTAGAEGAPVGPARLYSNVLKVKVAFSVNVEGSKSAEVTFTPAKDQYFAGDVVTISVDTKGDLNEFLGWSDGSMDTERTIELSEDLNLTANFKEVSYLAVWNLDELGSVNNKKYDAPWAPNYTTVADTYYLRYKTFDGTAYVDSTTSAFQTRNNKLSLDVIRYCTFLHSTKNQLDTLKQPDYIYLNVPAESPVASELTAYIGTDNYTSSVVNVDYSVDGGETWINLSKTTISEIGKWHNLKAEIPAELAGKAYSLRIQGDAEAERVTHPDLNPEDVSYEFIFIADIRLLTGEASSAISTIAADKAVRNVNAPIFDLMGRRVLMPQAGKLYLQDGVKFIQQ
jgi:hypothetical protein